MTRVNEVSAVRRGGGGRGQPEETREQHSLPAAASWTCCVDSPSPGVTLHAGVGFVPVTLRIASVVLQEIASKLGTRGKFFGAPLRWHAGKGSRLGRRGSELRPGAD